MGKVLLPVVFNYMNYFSFRQDVRLKLLPVFPEVRLFKDSSDEEQQVRNCCFKYRQLIVFYKTEIFWIV